MARIEFSILVPKSLEDTFSFLNQRESHLHFIPRMIALHQTSLGDFGRVGATADGVLNYFGVKIPVQYEIIEHVLNNRLAMKGKMGPILFKDGYILSAAENGTQIKFWLELLTTEWTRFLAPFSKIIGKIHAWETLRNLKKELENWDTSSNKEIASSSLRSSSQ